MPLPNEMLLDMLRFADFGTLISAKFVDARFLDVASKFAAELACRHSFQALFFPSYITYVDVTIGSRRKRIRYGSGNQSSLAAACRKLAGIVGPPTVGKLIFFENTWNKPGAGIVFDATPALKYAEDVCLRSLPGATIANESEPFMHNFAGTNSLRLSLNYALFRQFNWTFLRRESARELRRISVGIGDIDYLPVNATSPVEKIVRCCGTLPHMLGGEPVEIHFPENYLSAAFGLPIIEKGQKVAKL
ncbi:hypothetical protein AAVH_28165 [Aphelenchoides avenae]|nr:hypothetical protein AAVH_28165 [Aphelenchus avenae]